MKCEILNIWVNPWPSDVRISTQDDADNDADADDADNDADADDDDDDDDDDADGSSSATLLLHTLASHHVNALLNGQTVEHRTLDSKDLGSNLVKSHVRCIIATKIEP